MVGAVIESLSQRAEHHWERAWKMRGAGDEDMHAHHMRVWRRLKRALSYLKERWLKGR